MKLIKLSLVAALCATVIMAEDAKSDLGVSANVAMTTNYVWRGMTQTKDNMATQGGFDLDYKGVYAGIWGSGIDGGQELDVYAGYAGEISSFSYDVGLIQYAYPNQVDELNFAEVYAGVAYDFGVVAIGAKYSLGIDTNNDDTVGATQWEPENYVEADVSVPLPANFAVAAHYGMYSNIGSDYSAGVSTSVGAIGFDLSYIGFMADDKNGGSANDQDNIVFTLSSSF